MKAENKITIILVEPENPGNIGAVARAMANFGFKKLMLIKPKANHESEEAKKRAKHAQEILKRAIIKKEIPYREFSLTIATSGKLGNDYNITRTPLSPEQISKKIVESKVGKGRIAIIFGPESKGLTNEEIRKADIFTSIPTSKKYPVMNLSHAVTIILYEIFIAEQEKEEKGFQKEYPLMNNKQKEIIINELTRIINNTEFKTKEQRETQIRVWKRIISKSLPTKREANAMIGLLKKIKKEEGKEKERKKEGKKEK